AGSGFTLTRAGVGLQVRGFSTGHITIAGNIALNNAAAGFTVFSGGSSIRLSDNRAISNMDGFNIQQALSPTLERNVATGNTGQGFFVAGAFGAQLIGNSALHNGGGNPLADFQNGAGFNVIGPLMPASGYVLRDNASLGNVGAGFLFGRV